MTNLIVDMPPQRRARIAGGFYVIAILSSIFSFVVPSAANVALGIAGLAYVGVTILFYFLFKPVNKGASLLAALLSFAGIAVPSSLPLSFSIAMTFFGFYCLLIGYLAFKSTYLPRILGVLLAIGGICYLFNGFAHFLSLAFAPHLLPYIILPGFGAETLLCLWLLVKGVDVQRWQEKVDDRR